MTDETPDPQSATGPAALPGPDAPVAEHLDAIAAGADGAVDALVRALAARQLWVGVSDIPEELRGQSFKLGNDAPLNLMVSTLPDGGSAMLVFSSREQVELVSPEVVPVAFDGKVLLGMVVSTFAGLVLDAGLHGQALRSDWVSAAFAEHQGKPSIVDVSAAPQE